MIKERHKVKRRLAIISFAVIVITLFSMLLLSLFGDENTATILNSSSGIIVMVLGCLTTIIGAYLGLSHHDDMKNGDN